MSTLTGKKGGHSLVKKRMGMGGYWKGMVDRRCLDWKSMLGCEQMWMWKTVVLIEQRR